MTSCESGVTFQDVEGQSLCLTCSSCGPGTFVTAECNVTADAVCEPCIPGMFSVSGVCESCDDGFHSSAGSSYCSPCPAGKYGKEVSICKERSEAMSWFLTPTEQPSMRLFSLFRRIIPSASRAPGVSTLALPPTWRAAGARRESSPTMKGLRFVLSAPTTIPRSSQTTAASAPTPSCQKLTQSRKRLAALVRQAERSRMACA